MPDESVNSLGTFLDGVREIREDWRIPDHKELWFRGEAKRHEKSLSSS